MNKGIVGAALLVVVGAALGLMSGLGGLGWGRGGGGASDNAAPSATPTEAPAGVLVVRIAGSNLMVDDQSRTAGQIVQLAKERKVTLVRIVRDEDATRRAKEELIAALDQSAIAHQQASE